MTALLYSNPSLFYCSLFWTIQNYCWKTMTTMIPWPWTSFKFPKKVLIKWVRPLFLSRELVVMFMNCLQPHQIFLKRSCTNILCAMSLVSCHTSIISHPPLTVNSRSGWIVIPGYFLPLTPSCHAQMLREMCALECFNPKKTADEKCIRVFKHIVVQKGKSWAVSFSPQAITGHLKSSTAVCVALQLVSDRQENQIA